MSVRRRREARSATLKRHAALDSSMHVTVDVVNGPTETVTVDDDATYADLLGAVGFGRHEATVLVDEAPVPEDATVEANEVRVLRLVSGG